MVEDVAGEVDRKSGTAVHDTQHAISLQHGVAGAVGVALQCDEHGGKRLNGSGVSERDRGSTDDSMRDKSEAQEKGEDPVLSASRIKAADQSRTHARTGLRGTQRANRPC